MQTNALYYGDCLDWMEQWDDQSVDLIYLDPPFNSKATYNQLYYTEEADDEAQYRAFADTWTWDEDAQDRLDMYENARGRKAHDAIVGLKRILGASGMLSYLTYMAERLEQMHRLLKPTGSIYLHCDPTACHYLKILMDNIYQGGGAFRNEIIWHYQTGGASKNWFARKHDNILFFSKTNDYIFESDSIRMPRTEKALRRARNPKGARISSDDTTKLPMDVWTDIQALNPMARERLGYPTQKPLALLERILTVSSNEGDIVLDPFCGCGTTVEAARKLNRQFVGIDISSFAIDLVLEKRLEDKSIPAYGIPQDLRSAEKLAKEKPFDFESWAVTRLPGFAPNTKQVADGGVDGRATIANKPDDDELRKLALAQVKGGRYNLSELRDFIGVTQSKNAALGYYITLAPITSRAAKVRVLDTGKVSINGQWFPRMQLWSINDYFDNTLPRLPMMTDPYTGKQMLPQLF